MSDGSGRLGTDPDEGDILGVRADRWVATGDGVAVARSAGAEGGFVRSPSAASRGTVFCVVCGCRLTTAVELSGGFGIARTRRASSGVAAACCGWTEAGGAADDVAASITAVGTGIETAAASIPASKSAGATTGFTMAGGDSDGEVAAGSASTGPVAPTETAAAAAVVSSGAIGSGIAAGGGMAGDGVAIGGVIVGTALTEAGVA